MLAVLLEEVRLEVEDALEVEGLDVEELLGRDLGCAAARGGEGSERDEERGGRDGTRDAATPREEEGPAGAVGAAADSQCRQRRMGTVGLSFLTSRSTLANVFSLTRSILLSRTLSAKHTCSTDSFSTPSGFSSARRARISLASTWVMTASRAYISWMASSTKKVWTTGAGSASPVVCVGEEGERERGGSAGERGGKRVPSVQYGARHAVRRGATRVWASTVHATLITP